MKPYKIIEHKKYKGMYYLVWEDGVKSQDFYNLTRANDILKNYDLYRYNMQRPDPTERFKGRFVKAAVPADALE